MSSFAEQSSCNFIVFTEQRLKKQFLLNVEKIIRRFHRSLKLASFKLQLGAKPMGSWKNLALNKCGMHKTWLMTKNKMYCPRLLLRCRSRKRPNNRLTPECQLFSARLRPTSSSVASDRWAEGEWGLVCCKERNRRVFTGDGQMNSHFLAVPII